MSSNFYQATAEMVDVDLHLYLTIVPPSGLPVKLDHYPHVADACIGYGNGLVKTVTADGNPVVQENSTVGPFESLVPVIHLPILPPPPHPGQLLNFVVMSLFSSSKAKLAKASVQAAGEPLAYCLYGWYGWNVNCSDLPVWRGRVVSFTTVVTQTELADVTRAIVSAAWDFAVKKAVESVFKSARIESRLKAELRKHLHLHQRWPKAIAQPLVKLADKLLQKAIKWVAPKIITAIVNGNPVDLPVGRGLL